MVAAVVVEQGSGGGSFVGVVVDSGYQAYDEGVIAERDQLVDGGAQPDGGAVQDRFAGVEGGPEGAVGETIRGGAGEATKAELLERAKKRGIAGRSRMSKAELEAALAD